MKFSHSAIVHVTIKDLVPYQGNARTHSRRQIAQIAGSIERFGFLNPKAFAIILKMIAAAGMINLPQESEPDVSITLEEERMFEGYCARFGLNDSSKKAGHE
jgi:hypothetical protein